MNKKIIKSVIGLVGASLLVTGCVVRERTVYRPGPPPPPAGESYNEVDVSGPPPPDQTDVVVGVAPGPDFIWVGGFWGWGPGGWMWHRGNWAHRPHRGAVWDRPHYVFRGGRHVWVRGGWR